MAKRDSIDEVVEKDIVGEGINRKLELVDSDIEDELHELMEISEEEEEVLKKELREIEELEETVSRGLNLADEIHKYDQEIQDINEHVQQLMESDEPVNSRTIERLKEDLQNLQTDLERIAEILTRTSTLLRNFEEAVEEEQRQLDQFDDLRVHLHQGIYVIEGTFPESLSIDQRRSTPDRNLSYGDGGMLGEIEDVRQDLGQLRSRS
jgi:DNA repair ATPase RecN